MTSAKIQVVAMKDMRRGCACVVVEDSKRVNRIKSEGEAAGSASVSGRSDHSVRRA
jgi:hypothetical protein